MTVRSYKFKDIARVVTGGTPKKHSENYDGDIPFVTPGDLGEVGVISSTTRTLTRKGADSIRPIPEGSVMVCCIGATVGKVGIASKEVATNQQINSLVVDQSIAFPKYVYYFCKTLKDKLMAASSSTTMPIVNKTTFSELEIPLPPLEDQKRIAAILDKADAIRQKRKQAIALADEFLRSVFLEMFGDPVTNPKGWEVKSFGELGVWASGGTPSRSIAEYFEGEIDWYSARELNHRYLNGSVEKITEDALKNSAAKIFPAGSMLVGMYDTAALKISILKKDAASNQACANITPNELVNIEWLYSYVEFSKDTYLRQRRGVRQKNLNLGMIKDFKLPLPPVEEQLKYVTLVKKVIAIKENSSEHLELTVSSFDSLSQKAFSGQL